MITPDDLLLERYFRDSLNSEEIKQFENRKRDPKFLEQFVLEKQLFESLNEKSWNYASNIDQTIICEYQELFESADIKKLKSTLNMISSEKATKNFNWRPFFYAAAAVVIVILSISGFNNESSSPEDIYISYFDKSELTYSIVRSGNTEPFLNKITELFLNGEYELAIPLIEETISNNENDIPVLYIMKGVSLTEMGSYEDASIVYDKLIASDYLDAQKGYWYKALLHLKKGDVEKALLIFNKIKNENLYNSDKSAEIIELMEN